jgi:hypothetical protein
MTVCIAALADGGKRAILVADQLITHGFMGWAVESEDTPKIHAINSNSVIMTAGDASTSHEIVKIARTLTVQNPTLGFIEIARSSYSLFRTQKLEQLFINSRGLTLKDFYDRHTTLQGEIVREIDEKFATWDLGVQLIAVSYLDGACSLGIIWNPGVTQQLDGVGYACVGEGGPHATYAMLDLGYTKNQAMNDVKKIVLEAKKRSEKAPTVGKKTTQVEFPSGQAVTINASN